MLESEWLSLSWMFAFFLLHLIVPGPNMLCLTAHAVRGGPRAAISFSVGNAIGRIFWAASVAFGMATIAKENPSVFDAIRMLLGLVLVFFGARILKAVFMPEEQIACTGQPKEDRPLLSGLFLTFGNVNEFVFWGAVITFGASAQMSLAYSITLISGTGIVSLMFDLSLAFLVLTGSIGRLAKRLERPLAAALGFAYCLCGGSLVAIL